MEAVAAKGLTKSIGLSNFNSQQVKRVLYHCTIKPVCNQVLYHIVIAESIVRELEVLFYRLRATRG